MCLDQIYPYPFNSSSVFQHFPSQFLMFTLKWSPLGVDLVGMHGGLCPGACGLSGATSPKKTDSPFPSTSHQLSIAFLLGGYLMTSRSPSILDAVSLDPS